MTDQDKPIPAATVLLIRNAPALEVLMIERHADVGFAGGALVFPGGRIDPGDHAPGWAARMHGAAPKGFPPAAAVAAIREAFEEAGILLARQADGAPVALDLVEALQVERAAVEADDARFLALFGEHDLKLDFSALQLFAHWIAPPGLHKRFDTAFYIALCPDGQEAREDGNEATEAFWTSPADALASAVNGARKIIFPTARNLELLGCCSTAEEALEDAGRRTIRAVLPSSEMIDGEIFLTIPDDLGYPVTREKLKLASRS